MCKTISIAITSLLDDQFEHLDTQGSVLLFEMFMVGKKPASASPTIIFSCDRKYSRQKAMNLVEKKKILADYPGVRIAQSEGVSIDADDSYNKPHSSAISHAESVGSTRTIRTENSPRALFGM